jgi:hypothetical protein
MSTPVPASRLDLGERRRWIYGEAGPTFADIESLAAFGPQFGDDPEFCALLHDVARDAVTLDVDPRGYVGEADAAALIALIGREQLSARARVALLIGVLGPAVSAPPALADFAVREVERAILTAGRVEGWHVEALRAFCFAAKAGDAAHVDRAAAETLFDIAHATATADNDPAFADFFARAVGDYLLGAAFVVAPSREAELARERAMDARPTFGAYLSGLAGGWFGGRSPSVEQLADDIYAQENAETEARLAAAQDIDAGEAQWLIAHLARGGELSGPERRLLAFLREEGAAAPPEVAALIDRAA